MSIAILAPRAAGLTEDQAYLPALVQGEFVSNFSDYSAMSVLDRQRLDEQYAELLSGYYDDDAKAGLDLGHLAPTEYIMGGSITKTASGYALHIGITKSADKMTEASWSGTCTFAELDDLSGIRRASLDLLGKMGVALTGKAAAELSGAAARGQAKAQTALAQGITAQKSGNAAASLGYYYQAAQYDPRLKEAAARVNQLAATVRTGSLGEDIRNDIVWRDQWIKLYEEAYDYIEAHPDALAEFEYSPRLKQEEVDYDKRTVTFSARLKWKAIQTPPSWKMLDDLDKGLKATGRNNEWKLKKADRYTFFDREYEVTVGLYDDKGRCIATDTVYCPIDSYSNFLNMYSSFEVVRIGKVFDFESKEMSFVVSADDITDNMTIKIEDIKEFGRNKALIRSGPDIIPVRVMR
jgi:hypothetical protein